MGIALIPKEKLEGFCGLCGKEFDGVTVKRNMFAPLMEAQIDHEMCDTCKQLLTWIDPELTVKIAVLGASIAVRDKMDEIARLEADLAKALGEEEV